MTAEILALDDRLKTLTAATQQQTAQKRSEQSNLL
jgi:hypothetical protein